MKTPIFLLFLCSLILLGSCEDKLSYNINEAPSLESFEANSVLLEMSPSVKIPISGTSLSLMTSVSIVNSEDKEIPLQIISVLSNSHAEVKLPVTSITEIDYNEKYNLIFHLSDGTNTSEYISAELLTFLYLEPIPYSSVVSGINVKSVFEISGKDILGIIEVSIVDKSNDNERLIKEFIQTNTSFSFEFPPIIGDHAIVNYSYISNEGVPVSVVYSESVEVVKENVEIGSSLDGKLFTPRSLLRIQDEGAVNMDLIDKVEFVNGESVIPATILFQEEASLGILVPQDVPASSNTTLRLRYYDSEIYKDATIEVLVPTLLPNINVIKDYSSGLDDDDLNMAGGSTISFLGSNLSSIKQGYMIDAYGNEVVLKVADDSTDTAIGLVLPYGVSVGDFKTCKFLYEDGSEVYDYISDANVSVIGNPLEYLFFDEGGEKTTESWAKSDDNTSGAVGYFDVDGNQIPLMLNPGFDTQHHAPSGSSYMGFRWSPSNGTIGTKIQTYMFYGIFGHATRDGPIGFSTAQKYLHFYYKTEGTPPPRVHLTFYNNGLNNSVPSFYVDNFSTEDISEISKKDGWLLCRVDLSKIDMKAGGLAGIRAIRFLWYKYTAATGDSEGFMDRMTLSDRMMPNAYQLN